MSSSSQNPRLAFKRAFVRYYLDLCAPGVADPTDAFAACTTYVQSILDRGEPESAGKRLEREFTRLAGEIEQDLRQHHREVVACLGREPLLERLHECLDVARERLT